ncbi:CBS domain-containing protein [Vibrio kasasachensis]|uniref:CBS domain-containing protein n=1 Tax=Vibrio kasasachensis TaxID=2910248 RepID=UPI003D120E01
MITVEDMMTRNPHTLLRSHLLVDAKHTMEALDIRHIPIVDGDRHLLGIITQRDVLAAQDSSLQDVSEEESFTLNTPLYEIMRTSVMNVTPKAGLKETAMYMQKHKVGCLPVVDKGRLVGIITNSDFVSIAISLLELQEEVEPEEIED